MLRNRFIVWLKNVWGVLLFLFLAACSLSKEAEQNIEQQQTIASEAFNSLEVEPLKVREPRNVQIVDDFYIAFTEVEQREGDPLPNLGDELTYVIDSGLSLLDHAGILRDLSGLRFFVDQPPSTGVGDFREVSRSSGDLLFDASGQGVSPSDRPISQGQVVGQPVFETIDYVGDLEGLLDQIASAYQMDWIHENGEVRFYKFRTEIYTLTAVPGVATLKSGIQSNAGSQSGGSGGGAGVGGGSGQGAQSNVESDTDQGVTLEATIELWAEIEQALTSIVAGRGNVQVSPSTGSVVVSAPNRIHHEVAKYVKEQRQRLARSVTLDINVYSLAVSREEGIDLSFDAVASAFEDQVSFRATGDSAVQVSDGAGRLSIGVLEGASGSLKNLAGSELALELLRSRGKVAVVNTARVQAANFQVVPVHNIRPTSFVRERGVALSGTSGLAQSQIVTGSIDTGFTMSILPVIQDDGTVLLQYSLTLRELTGPIPVFGGSDQTQVQLPEFNTRSFIQSVFLKDRQPLVVGGLEQFADSRVNAQGGPFGLGVADATSSDREMIVIVVTPSINSNPAVRFKRS